MLLNLLKINGYPGRPRCPSITASPGAPGTGPGLYQPTSQMLRGVAIAPNASRPTASTDASRWRDGISNRTGRGRVGSSGVNVCPPAATPGRVWLEGATDTLGGWGDVAIDPPPFGDEPT